MLTINKLKKSTGTALPRTRFSFLFFLFLFAAFSPAFSQEFRGAWVASVWNLNFPSKTGLSQESQKQEIVSLLETARRTRINNLFVQVRPESCALYPSSLEPWSRYLTGSQGSSPGYDPLAFFIAEGKKRGIAIHAWLNPFRAAVNASQPRHPSHVSNRFPEHAKRYGNLLWMDPGAPSVQRHVVAVAQDLARRYDLAGIHLDDYFYPYPESSNNRDFPDSDSYSAYTKNGGPLSRADWRRDNVNSLVRDIHRAVKAEKPSILFGISPFGIYTKGSPSDVKAGLDQLNELYSDPLKWMSEGWVDYLAPQLYWKEGGQQSFSSLLRWWRDPSVNPRGIPIFPGIAIDRMEGSHKWPLSEIATQLRIEQSIPPRRPGGFILYNMAQLSKNTKGIDQLLAK